MIDKIYSNILYFLELNLRTDVLWSILPLAICTILIISYFTRHKDERAGWNTYFSNSLVLLFVSINLFRYIYNLDLVGAQNYLEYPIKSLAVVLLLTAGMLIVKFNFSHLLPERYARTVSNPLSINLVAYAIILFVHSSLGNELSVFIALLVIVLVLGLFFWLLRFPLSKIFVLVEKEQQKERFRLIKEAKLQIDELNRELKSRKKELSQIKLKKLEKERKIAIKLKKELKK